MGLCRRVGNSCLNRRLPSEVVSLSLSLDQRLAYIKNAAIKPSSGDLPVTSGPGRTRDINPSTSVVDGNFIAFGHGVSKEPKTAVERSDLYAQFVANAKYNRVTQTGTGSTSVHSPWVVGSAKPASMPCKSRVVCTFV